MKILFVTNEAQTVREMEQMLRTALPGAVFLTPLYSVEDAIGYLHHNPAPDLAFFEVQMRDGLSFQILKESKQRFPVVYISSNTDHVLQSIKADGVDYLVRPILKTAITQMVARLVMLETLFSKSVFHSKQADAAANDTSANDYKQTFLVNHRDKMVPVHVSDIAYFYIEHEVTFIFTFDQKRFVINHTLDEVEELIAPKQFYRANRQYLVNRSAVKEVEHAPARKLVLKMALQTKEPVMVSKAKASRFLKWLNGSKM
jgi:two-component system, LytTR family, response regulator LytT